ncbi:MAG: PD-(D/E)XK nuclease family protein [Clostridia bacterium]|nr:PD-(D/E)XK nuclease family protein [Clostridia bacterium]
MIKASVCSVLSTALEKLKSIISANEGAGRKTLIFCEDRLTLAAERAVCAAVGGTFSVSVYTFARFLSSERGKRADILTAQGSAMAIRKIIEEKRDSLKLFGKFSAAAAAGAVYDTIALLYSSKISADDLKKADADGLLESKLHDISAIYSEYESYLEKSGKIDRNAYLSELPQIIEKSEKIAGSDVIFLGFQSFTRSSLDCAKAAFKCAKNVYGLFIGGSEEIYVNEALTSFEGAAEEYGGAEVERVQSGLIKEAEILRKSLFDPESFHIKNPVATDRVHLFEALDEEEELEFIAASIKKFVLDGGERYGDISVMLPDVGAAERGLRRVFSQYRIPYYADRRRTLSEHAVAAFILDYLVCLAQGCPVKECDAVISSPLFPAEREDKDIYRNYALRLANFRGGIRREPNPEILAKMNFDYDAVQRVRTVFFKGFSCLKNGTAEEVCGGVINLLEALEVKTTLENLAEKFKDDYPAESEFCGRVYEAALGVIAEAEIIAGGGKMPISEFIKILKSGFGALEISLIPPKADAVFVGDIAATANTGSNVVFAAQLSDDVPASSSDTALLTDSEISQLEGANLAISPKIRQVNMRRREQTALNICAFKKQLYLSYSVRVGGEESGVSEIVAYAKQKFLTPAGGELKAVNIKRLEKSDAALVYYCSEKIPALKRLTSLPRAETLSAVYGCLKENGFEKEADAALEAPRQKVLSDGRSLFVSYNSITPTMLETYFSCPYKNFIQNGLKLQEREEGTLRPVDTGNFIHTVLQRVAPEMEKLTSETVAPRAEEIADGLLKDAPYSSLCDSKSGGYTAQALIKEAGVIASGMFEQLANSSFKIESAEYKCEVPLFDGVKVFGRIDRVDTCGDLVRIIDYKTGTIDSSPAKYYMGLKLQLPLYLTSASKGRRAAGAYYFPASVEYKDKADGVFRLQGFMDGSDEVVTRSDVTLQPKEKSRYFDAYLGGGRSDKAMTPEVFSEFLEYSQAVAKQGAGEMLEGNIAPSPAEGECSFCKAGGSCAFAVGADGEQRSPRAIKCGEIANVVKRLKEGE